MHFKPIDEMSLRQLFSSQYAEELLKLSYVGPVLNDAGRIDDSPDAIVLDRRNTPYQPLRCEFKFIPSSADDFAHNGRFELAVVWALAPGVTRQGLVEALGQDHGCIELIVMSQNASLERLPDYNRDAISRVGGVGAARARAERSQDYSIYALAIAAKIYPNSFAKNSMIEVLQHRFPAVRRMTNRGRHNAVTSHLMAIPQLIVRMHGDRYRWNGEYDNVIAYAELESYLVANVGIQPPSQDECQSMVF